MLHTSPTSYHLAASKHKNKQTTTTKQQQTNKGHTKSEEILKAFLESRQENGLTAEKGEDTKSKTTTRQNNKTAGQKVKPNDSPEIPDRGRDMRHPWSHFGGRATVL